MAAKEMIAQRDAAYEKANALLTAADARDGKMSEDERADLKTYMAELNDLGDKIAEAEKAAAELQAARDQIRKIGQSVAKADLPPEMARVQDSQLRGKSLGAMYAESPQYRQLMAQFHGGRIPDGFRINAAPVSIDMPARMMATLLTGLSSTAAGAFVVNDVQDIFVPTAMRMLTLIDLITVSGTDSDTVEYVRQTSRDNQAAPTAEATSTSDGTKPESAMVFEKVTHAVESIAHWIPATRRALSDVGQLRAIIDAELRYGLNVVLEDQMMNGSGSTPALRGLFNTSNIQTQAYLTDLYTTTRKAITKMRTVAMESPSAWVFKPANWEAFELLKDAENRYYHGGPLAVGIKSLWGYPVVECDAMQEGHGFLGNFRRAWLWMREGISITASDSHANFFIQNLVAILAELRATFGVTKPTAFVKISLNAAS